MRPSTGLRPPATPLPSRSRRLRITVPNTPAAPKAARDWLAGILCESPHSQLADDGLLCLSELVTNAHRHTSVPAIRVQALIAVEFVVVRVRDNCSKPLPVQAASSPCENGECGRGLALIEAYADAWGVTFPGGGQPQGKAVWFRLLARGGPG
ncbi:ATP-binding protein [Streptomyces albipurpureus]|uniref:ATP-binding protein n=1 Tax=Streptomyces albipurpureus TaxID=2897419 RepID=UPI003CE5476D